MKYDHQPGAYNPRAGSGRRLPSRSTSRPGLSGTETRIPPRRKAHRSGPRSTGSYGAAKSAGRSARSARTRRIRRSFDGRLLGQTWETPFVPVPGGEITPAVVEEMLEAFHQVYTERTGNRFDAIPVQGVTFRVQVVVPIDKVSFGEVESGPGDEAQPDRSIVLRHLPGGEQTAGEHRREALRCGDRVAGPAIVREPLSTTHITAGQVATVGRYGELVVERS